MSYSVEHTIGINGIFCSLRVAASPEALLDQIGDSASSYTNEELECLFLEACTGNPELLRQAHQAFCSAFLQSACKKLQSEQGINSEEHY